MDRKTIADQLALADQHVAEGRRHVELQQDIVAGLERNGRDATEGRKLLAILQQTLATHLAHQERLQRELGAEA